MSRVLVHLPGLHDLDLLFSGVAGLEVLDVDRAEDGLVALVADAPGLGERVRGVFPGATLRPGPRRDGGPADTLHPPVLHVEGHPVHLGDGAAFGSGAHPTTRLCLDWLRHAAIPELVLDVGTGTGVLAVVAARRGARRVIAVDVDPDAVAEARRNVARNGVDGVVEVREGGPEGLPRAPLVLANILAGPLLTLAPALRRVVARQGELLLSGIPAGLVDELAAVYVRDGFRNGGAETEAGWGRLLLRAGW